MKHHLKPESLPFTEGWSGLGRTLFGKSEPLSGLVATALDAQVQPRVGDLPERGVLYIFLDAAPYSVGPEDGDQIEWLLVSQGKGSKRRLVRVEFESANDALAKARPHRYAVMAVRKGETYEVYLFIRTGGHYGYSGENK